MRMRNALARGCVGSSTPVEPTTIWVRDHPRACACRTGPSPEKARLAATGNTLEGGGGAYQGRRNSPRRRRAGRHTQQSRRRPWPADRANVESGSERGFRRSSGGQAVAGAGPAESRSYIGQVMSDSGKRVVERRVSRSTVGLHISAQKLVKIWSKAGKSLKKS